MAERKSFKQVWRAFSRRISLKDCADPRVDSWCGIGQSKAVRDEQGLFQVEGVRLVELLLRDGIYPVEALIVAGDEIEKRQEDMRERVADILVQLDDQVPVFDVTRDIFRRIADVKKVRGVMAIARRGAWCLDDLLADVASEGGVLLAAVNVTDPGNLGTLARNAYAFGARALITLEGTTDPFSPKAIRASSGHLPIMVAESWKRLRRLCSKLGVTLAGLDANHEEAIDLRTADKNGSAWVVCVGSEGVGFPDFASEFDVRIRIPMLKGSESLNVGVAGALMLWELGKSRLS